MLHRTRFGPTRSVSGRWLAMAPLVAGCISGSAPPTFTDVDTLGLAASTIYASREAGLQIFEIDVADSEIVLTTSYGLMTLRESDSSPRVTLAVPDGGRWFGVRALVASTGDRSIAGFDPPNKQLTFVSASGKRTSHACRDCWDTVSTSTDPARPDQLAVRNMDGSGDRVWDVHGVEVSQWASPGYITSLMAGRMKADARPSLLSFTAPDPEFERAIRVRDAGGIETAKWKIVSGRATAILQPEGPASVLALHADSISEYDATTGARLWEANLPAGASQFRSLQATRWRDDSRVVVLSSAGRAEARHLVFVLGSAGEVLFQRAAKGRSFALHAPSPDATHFYVGSEGTLTKFGS